MKSMRYTNEMGISPNLHKQSIKGSYKDLMTQNVKKGSCAENIYIKGVECEHEGYNYVL
jgi:hypothetical protein